MVATLVSSRHKHSGSGIVLNASLPSCPLLEAATVNPGITLMHDLKFENEDDETWVAKGCVTGSRPRFTVTMFNDDSAPDTDVMRRILARLNELDALVLAAAKLVRENYDTEHFRSLGVSDDRLVLDDTPQAMAAAMTLTSIQFFDATCKE